MTPVVSTPMVGFAETVMQPARRRRRRRFITTVVDIVSGQVLDVFEVRDAADLRFWLAKRPESCREAVGVIAVDPQAGDRSRSQALGPSASPYQWW